MIGFVAILVLLPLIVLGWMAAGLGISSLWRMTKENLAVAKQADENARKAADRAFEILRRGY